ncbi:MAG: TetR/AcrR family transcriptional regulator [Candidatus Cloacimonetes bacterium]|nr:TetR/AcrR family transcriptional regulator [Candidatus Cloacimonadota bacterium]
MKEKKISVEDKKLQKRDAIIKSAIEVFAQKGFHNAKISDIAKRAKVADGTVYLYFNNKDDLMIQAMSELLTEKLFELKKRLTVEKKAINKLYRFFQIHAQALTGDRNVARFITVELRQCQEFYEKYPEFTPIADYIDFVEDLITQAIEDGDIRKEINPRAYAMILLGTVDFVVTQWVLGKDNMSLEKTIEQISQVFQLKTALLL